MKYHEKIHKNLQYFLQTLAYMQSLAYVHPLDPEIDTTSTLLTTTQSLCLCIFSAHLVCGCYNLTSLNHRLFKFQTLENLPRTRVLLNFHSNSP